MYVNTHLLTDYLLTNVWREYRYLHRTDGEGDQRAWSAAAAAGHIEQGAAEAVPSTPAKQEVSVLHGPLILQTFIYILIYLARFLLRAQFCGRSIEALMCIEHE